MSVSYQPLNGLISAQGNVNNNELKHKSGSQFKQITGFSEIDEETTTNSQSVETNDNSVLDEYIEITPLMTFIAAPSDANNNDEISLNDFVEDDILEQGTNFITDISFDKSDDNRLGDNLGLGISNDQDDDFNGDDKTSDLISSSQDMIDNRTVENHTATTQKIIDDGSESKRTSMSNEKLHFLNLLGGKYQQVLTSQHQGDFESVETTSPINNFFAANDKFALEIMNMSQGNGRESDINREKLPTDTFKKSDELDLRSIGTLSAALQSQNGSAEMSDTDLDYGLSIDAPFANREDWNNQLHQNILWMSSQKMHSASISMNPTELGPVDVNIQFKNDALSIVFNSKHHEVRQAIEHALPELRQLFADQTIQINSIDITDMHQNPQHSSGYHGEQTQHEQQQTESFSQLLSGSVSVDDISPEDEQIITHRTKTSIIDFFA